jgi:hypothetical protein
MMLAKCNCYSLDRRIDELGEHNERLRDLLSDAIGICDAAMRRDTSKQGASGV